MVEKIDRKNKNLNLWKVLEIIKKCLKNLKKPWPKSRCPGVGVDLDKRLGGWLYIFWKFELQKLSQKLKFVDQKSSPTSQKCQRKYKWVIDILKICNLISKRLTKIVKSRPIIKKGNPFYQNPTNLTFLHHTPLFRY